MLNRFEVVGTVRVIPGNTVNISFGTDAATTWAFGMRTAKGLVADNPKGFDETTMELVKPEPPFVEGSTTERYPDTGMHASVAIQGLVPYESEDGIEDKITTEMKAFEGRKITLSFDVSDWYWLEGSPANDDGTRVVFRLACNVDKTSEKAIVDLREEMTLGRVRAVRHVTMAGVRPKDGDYVAFRERYCRPRPPVGLPDPYPELRQYPATPTGMNL